MQPKRMTNITPDVTKERGQGTERASRVKKQKVKEEWDFRKWEKNGREGDSS